MKAGFSYMVREIIFILIFTIVSIVFVGIPFYIYERYNAFSPLILLVSLVAILQILPWIGDPGSGESYGEAFVIVWIHFWITGYAAISVAELATKRGLSYRRARQPEKD